MQINAARVYASQADDTGKRPRVGGGPQGALRAYQAFHPDAAIYTVTYRGRTVWMTSKQQAIWHEVQKYWHRGKRDTLARIAGLVGCSRATVSRFLRRLDLWRFIDLATLRGRNGGTFIFTRQTPPLQEIPRRWTMSARKRVRDYLAGYIRQKARAMMEPLLAAYRVGRLPKPKYWETAEQQTLGYLGGSTGATYMLPNEVKWSLYR
jgi:hypothetical protein